MNRTDILWYCLLTGIAEDIRLGHRSGSEFVFYNTPYIVL